MKRLLNALTFILALAASGGLASAQVIRNHQEIMIEPSPADAVQVTDMDGDGLKDLVLQTGKTVRVRLLTKENDFLLRRRTSVELPSDVFMFCVADIDNQKGCELVTMTPRGVFYYPFKDRKFAKEPVPVLEIPTIFTGSLDGVPLMKEFVVDLNGDGRNDLIVPQEGKLLVFTQNEGGKFALNQRISVPMTVSLDIAKSREMEVWTSWSCTFPPLYMGDFNADSRTDLMIFDTNRLLVYPAGADGTFSAEPAASGVVDMLKKKKRRDFSFEVPPKLVDLNKDGFVDMIVTYPSKGKTAVFFGGKDGFNLTSPDTLINVDGWTFGHWAMDVNGDGRLDLILATMEKLGIIGFLEVAITKKVDLQAQVYLCGADGRYVAEPSHVHSISVPFVAAVTSGEISIRTPFLISFAGDFNGDGVKDMLVKTSPTELTVYRGDRQKVVTDQVLAKYETMDTQGYFTGGEPWIEDLNGDGKLDIVIHLEDFEDRQHVIEVILTK